MDFTPTPEQREVAELAARVLGDLARPERVALVEASADGVDRDLWRQLADAGLLGLAVPSAYGGSDLTMLELCLLLEQQGRHVAPVPLLPTLVLGAVPLARWGTEAQRGRWLPGVLAGDVMLTAALADAPGRDPREPSTVATRGPGGWRLDGVRPSVPAAHVAARVLVPAATEAGPRLFLVDPAAPGVLVEPAVTTSREVHGHVHLAQTPVPDDDVLDAGAQELDLLVQYATTAWCAVQVGVAEEAVRLAAAYTSERHQFGRPLASFQGVALRAADAYVDTEAMRVTMLAAAWRLAAGLEAEREVAVAKWWAAEAGHRAVHAVQHLHGGMGADVDYPVHRYFLWGKQIDAVLGGASEQLARLGRRIAADATAGVSGGALA